MPLLDPTEVVALGLSTKDIPAYGSQTSPQKAAARSSRQVGSSVQNITPPVRRSMKNSNLPTTASFSSGSSTSSTPTSASSPALSTSKFAFGAGAEIGSNFEVCIKIPSKRKLAILQQYERFPDADQATKEVRVAEDHDAHKGEGSHESSPGHERVPEEILGETAASVGATNAPESSIESLGKGQEGAADHMNEPNGSLAHGGLSEKQPILEDNAPIVPVTSEPSL